MINWHGSLRYLEYCFFVKNADLSKLLARYSEMYAESRSLNKIYFSTAWTDRQTDRQSDRHSDSIQTDIQTDKQRDR